MTHGLTIWFSGNSGLTGDSVGERGSERREGASGKRKGGSPEHPELPENLSVANTYWRAYGIKAYRIWSSGHSRMTGDSGGEKEEKLRREGGKSEERGRLFQNIMNFQRIQSTQPA